MWNLNYFFETPGIGGAVAYTAIIVLIVCYGLTIRWISKGHTDEAERH